MREVVLSLIQKERVNSIISITDIEYKDLHILEICYVKDNKYCKVRTYYTDLWASDSPLGPIGHDSSKISFESLSDISTIIKYDSISELERSPRLQKEELKMIYDVLHRGAIEFVNKYINVPGIKIPRAKFTFTPVPTIVLMVYDNQDRFSGTIAYTLDGTVRVVTRITDSVDSVAQWLESQHNLPLVKEFF